MFQWAEDVFVKRNEEGEYDEDNMDPEQDVAKPIEPVTDGEKDLDNIFQLVESCMQAFSTEIDELLMKCATKPDFDKVNIEDKFQELMIGLEKIVKVAFCHISDEESINLRELGDSAVTTLEDYFKALYQEEIPSNEFIPSFIKFFDEQK